ncbi:hypothetical protein CAPTEDRAFT_225565 [Capitella teleta]|uniref:Uncharacterized protein n=1 Tax=Capitella teleta TaxID=283909 RepID=R7U3B7_CAPTE|nr:hypothetical protein CAPTEDRAFT_225565 [Capitella teleta]|eukprot:ELU00616.1 hypothetical protein CAPTEDRAFT_225565 [Capitella teleta]
MMSMTKEHKHILTKYRVELVEEITLDHALWDQLRTRGVITQSVHRNIMHNNHEKEQIGLLLDHLPRRPDTSFDSFCEALIATEQDHIVSQYLRQADQPECCQKRAINDSEDVSSSKKICLQDDKMMEEDDLDLIDGPCDVYVTHCRSQFYENHKRGAYPMNKVWRGHALIINVQTVMGQPPRKGTDIDRDKLEKLWHAMHFQTQIYNDEDGLGAEEIYEKVKAFVSKTTDEDQACVICLLSHGAEDRIFGSDGDTIPVTRIIRLLEGKNAPQLAGKPKILIMQACRGKTEDSGVRYEDEPDNAQLQPSGSDVIVCHPTLHGYMSWRNTQRGSWFISAIVQVLAKHAHDLDILKLLTRVNAAVSLKESSQGQKKQIPEFSSCLRKDLFFFPGIRK